MRAGEIFLGESTRLQHGDRQSVAHGERLGTSGGSHLADDDEPAVADAFGALELWEPYVAERLAEGVRLVLVARREELLRELQAEIAATATRSPLKRRAGR